MLHPDGWYIIRKNRKANILALIIFLCENYHYIGSYASMKEKIDQIKKDRMVHTGDFIDLEFKIVDLWFKRKTFEKIQNTVKFKEQNLIEISNNEILEKFVEQFWEIGKRLQDQKYFIGTFFKGKHPSVVLKTKTTNTLGQYDLQKNLITLFFEDPEYVDTKLYKIKNLESAKEYLPNIFLDTIPAKSFIHELSHAWRGQNVMDMMT